MKKTRRPILQREARFWDFFLGKKDRKKERKKVWFYEVKLGKKVVRYMRTAMDTQPDKW